MHATCRLSLRLQAAARQQCTRSAANTAVVGYQARRCYDTVAYLACRVANTLPTGSGQKLRQPLSAGCCCSSLSPEGRWPDIGTVLSRWAVTHHAPVVTTTKIEFTTLRLQLLRFHMTVFSRFFK